MNLREENSFELARLKSTDNLLKRLEKENLKNCFLQPKVDGQRYSLQIGGNEKPLLVSRSREGKRKGVGVASSKPFVLREPEPWMFDVHEKWVSEFGEDVCIVVDGELESIGDSTSSDVTRLDTEKRFTVFDLLYHSDLQHGGWTTTVQYKDRLELLEELIPKYDPRISIIPTEFVESVSVESLNTLFSVIAEKRKGGQIIEGYVLKPADWCYDKNWYGWKIKLEETQDGFVVACFEEKKHSLGKITKTGNVGTVCLSQFKMVGRIKTHQKVAIVPIPPEFRVPLVKANEVFLNSVVEFSHLGWNGKLFSFPQFIRFREDKGKDDCVVSDPALIKHLKS